MCFLTEMEIFFIEHKFHLHNINFLIVKQKSTAMSLG